MCQGEATGIMDNDWFAFLFTAPTFTENSPPEGRRINQPEGDKPSRQMASKPRPRRVNQPEADKP